MAPGQSCEPLMRGPLGLGCDWRDHAELFRHVEPDCLGEDVRGAISVRPRKRRNPRPAVAVPVSPRLIVPTTTTAAKNHMRYRIIAFLDF